jgi:hypothetical protein
LLGLVVVLVLVLVVAPGAYPAEPLRAHYAVNDPVGAHRQHGVADGDGERARGLGQRYCERALHLRAVRLEGIERLIQQQWISTIRGALPRWQAELLPLLSRQLADDAALPGVIDQLLGRMPGGKDLQCAQVAGDQHSPAIR